MFTSVDPVTWGQWATLVLTVLLIVGVPVAVGRSLLRCFDSYRDEIRDLRGSIDDLHDAIRHEADMQKQRHQANRETLNSQQKQVARLDADVSRTRLDVASNTALLHTLMRGRE